MSPMSSVGRFTAWRTMIIVTRPAEGMPAAPMAAAVAVILGKKTLITEVNDGQLVIRVAKSNAGKLCAVDRNAKLQSWTEQTGTGNPIPPKLNIQPRERQNAPFSHP